MSALDGEVGHATFPRNPDRLAEYKVGAFSPGTQTRHTTLGVFV